MFQSYLGLKKHLDDLRSKIATLQRDNLHEEEVIKKLRDSTGDSQFSQTCAYDHMSNNNHVVALM